MVLVTSTGSTRGSTTASYRAPISMSAAAFGLVLALSACDGGDNGVIDTALSQPQDGVTITDADGDGYDDTVDCNDSDSDIHPDATETPGDGVDSNCDDDDDT